ncbi:MAG: winged helix-turn-helix domain-containing protein [Candidatus Thorarchaeota archaeon]
MPEGLAVLKWDDELGPVVTTKTPKKLRMGIDPTTAMRVYGIATMGETEESERPGFSSLVSDEFNLAVYYGGLKMHLRGLPSMVFLVLGTDEEPDIYKDALPEIATQVFLKADDDEYIGMLPRLYRQIARYTEMTPEQRQASTLVDPVKRGILRILMKNGTVETSDLEQTVFDELGKEIDVDIILRPMVKSGIIATGWVEGLASEVIYLTRAIFLLRNVSTETIQAVRSGEIPGEIAGPYLDAVTDYHTNYIGKLREDLFEAIWSEASELAKHVLDIDAYEIVQLLRTSPRIADELLEALDMPKAKVRKKLKELEEADIVFRAKDDEKQEHVLLKCNPRVATVYPEWLIQRTADSYNDEEIPSRQAIHYLEVLKLSHPSQSIALGSGEMD